MSILKEMLMDKNKYYKKVEYISSDGDQYINTGYVLQAHDKVEVEFAINDFNTSYPSVFGARRRNYYYNCYTLFCGFADMELFAYGRTANETTSSINSEIGIKYKVVTQDSLCTITYNGGTSQIESTGTINDCVNPCGLFALNTYYGTGGGFTIDLPGSLDMYSFKIESNNVLIRNMIPVVLKTTIPDSMCADSTKSHVNGDVGMWDKVNDIFYANIGYSSFTAH